MCRGWSRYSLHKCLSHYLSAGYHRSFSIFVVIPSRLLLSFDFIWLCFFSLFFFPQFTMHFDHMHFDPFKCVHVIHWRFTDSLLETTPSGYLVKCKFPCFCSGVSSENDVAPMGLGHQKTSIVMWIGWLYHIRPTSCYDSLSVTP